MKEGEFIDEKIHALRENYRIRTAEYDLCTDFIRFHTRSVRFRWFSLFDGLFRILLPEDFTVMPKQIAAVRYPCRYRPPVILSGPDYDEDFGFHLIKDELGDLDSLIRQMRDSFLRHAPETVVYGQGHINLEEMDGVWFEYKNFTLDEETYGVQFLIRSDTDILAGVFNSRMMFYDEWKPLVPKILEQIERKGERY